MQHFLLYGVPLLPDMCFSKLVRLWKFTAES